MSKEIRSFIISHFITNKLLKPGSFFKGDRFYSIVDRFVLKIVFSGDRFVGGAEIIECPLLLFWIGNALLENGGKFKLRFLKAKIRL